MTIDSGALWPGRMIWRNGEFLPEERATLSIYDSAHLYGDGVFEMTRSFNKVPFKLDAHLDRLEGSLRVTGLNIPYTRGDLVHAHAALLELNEPTFAPDDEYRTLIECSRGPLPLYSHLRPEPWCMMTVYPLRWVLKGKVLLYREGVAAQVVRRRRLPAQVVRRRHLSEQAIPATVKHHNRLHFRLAEQEAGDTWPILLTENGMCVTEGTGANVVALVGGRLVSPHRNCLPGISRDYVLELAADLGIPTALTTVTQRELYEADEVFFTCTPWCIVPVTRLDGQPVGTGRVGPATTMLMERWEEAVGCGFRAQAEAWDSTA